MYVGPNAAVSMALEDGLDEACGTVAVFERGECRRARISGRVSVRNVRHEANDDIKKLEKAGALGEVVSKTNQKKVQDITDKFISLIDEALAKKEQEIKQV